MKLPLPLSSVSLHEKVLKSTVADQIHDNYYYRSSYHCFLNYPGNFPWIVPLLRAWAIHSKRAKNFALLEDVALSLVKARRENKQPGRVSCVTDEHAV